MNEPEFKFHVVCFGWFLSLLPFFRIWQPAASQFFENMSEEDDDPDLFDLSVFIQMLNKEE